MPQRIRDAGAKIREIRLEKNITLKELSEESNLSLSLISMIERGVANPSVGSLIALSDALHISVGALFDDNVPLSVSPVVRRQDQNIIIGTEGVSHRILVAAQDNSFQLSENVYEPGTSSALSNTRHRGKEFGVLIEGHLSVVIGETSHSMEPGDAIFYDSHSPHRIINDSKMLSRAIWVNLLEE